MRIYCKKCGAPTEYLSNKPKFCSSCGLSFSAKKESVTPLPPKQEEERQHPPKNPIPAFIIEDEENYDEGIQDSVNVNNIQGLDIEIEKNQNQGIKFGDALGTASGGGEGDKFIRDPDPDVTEEQFLKQFKEEAGSIRNTAPDED